ncbi:zinc-binding dehydrogenase [Kibdelosporangium philippinense]|uniref:Zinc-binding dehydrogenase n=1 Tax=Kibdelosporangium philippinense TaxID=211113 RepID=A0ABS8ZH62_9PSEU|nr:zinc-binding dehydrogenase [Kibdelosporangium philippinense]MCE7006817.1 zinc-binding dehydrogenase [Kibdelosporangium philippinense]
MKALVNAPGTDEFVRLTDVHEPTAGPHDALIRVHASSLNRGELRLLATRPAGWRPGQDIAGVVEKAAEDGSGPSVGTRVVALADDSGWAELVAVDTDRIAVLDDRVSFGDAATLPIAGTTALRTLRLGGSLLGKRVLVTGAAGGVGRYQVQLAALQGARVTAVASDKHEKVLLKLGAAEVVSSPAAAEGTFDLITESVGGESLSEAIGRVAPHGLIVVFGLSSGKATPFAFRDFAPGHENARIQIFMSYASGPDFGADLKVLSDLVADGSLTAQVGLEVPWTELATAAQSLSARGVDGKAVLQIV